MSWWLVVLQLPVVRRVAHYTRWWTAAIVVTVTLVVAVSCTAALTTAMSASTRLLMLSGGDRSAQQCRASGETAPETGGRWNAEQRAVAAVIVAKGAELGLPPRAWVIALATAMQESTLQNLDGGDLDSGGAFQQRPTQGWGTFEQVRDVTYAANAFYTHLVKVDGWDEMPVTQAAQTVQRSGFPGAYAKWEGEATALVGELGGNPGSQQVLCRSTPNVGGWQLPLDARFIVPPMREHHDYPAVDIGVPVGNPVFAITGGTVAVVNDPANCGTGVSVTGEDGAVWIYCHGSRLTTVGGVVAAGQELMLSGNTGSSTGPHLHVQVQVGGSYRCLQPLVDAIAAGQAPPAPAALKATYPCLA